jgi:crotonobetainyl-CoA:carnitine CoA-transferase CaiB-like acyl-CoA transferase
VPFQNFETADGWIVIACPKEKFWHALCDVLGRPDLAADGRFDDFAGRDRNRDVLLAELEAAFAARTTASWLEALAAAGVPSAPVNDVATALADPQAVARGAIVEAEHERFGTIRTIASPLRVGDERRPVERAPRRGEHTASVLAELCGYDEAAVESLAASGAFGRPLTSDPV